MKKPRPLFKNDLSHVLPADLLKDRIPADFTPKCLRFSRILRKVLIFNRHNWEMADYIILFFVTLIIPSPSSLKEWKVMRAESFPVFLLYSHQILLPCPSEGSFWPSPPMPHPRSDHKQTFSVPGTFLYQNSSVWWTTGRKSSTKLIWIVNNP